MTYRVEPHATARAQLGGFPQAAFDALIAVLADVADYPYDPLRTFPGDDDQHRWATFGGHGIVSYYIDDARELVTVYDVTWTG